MATSLTGYSIQRNEIFDIMHSQQKETFWGNNNRTKFYLRGEPKKLVDGSIDPKFTVRIGDTTKIRQIHLCKDSSGNGLNIFNENDCTTSGGNWTEEGSFLMNNKYDFYYVDADTDINSENKYGYIVCGKSVQTLIEDYDSVKTYTQGQIVRHKNVLYIARTDIAGGVWDEDDWILIEEYEADETVFESPKTIELFNNSKNYSKGDIAIFEGNYYSSKYNNNNGDFNVSKWEKIARYVEDIDFFDKYTYIFPYDNDQTYNINDLCKYDDGSGSKKYYCIENNVTNQFDPSIWREIPTFNPRVLNNEDSLYKKGDYVEYSGLVYRAINDVVSGPWRLEFWEEVYEYVVESHNISENVSEYKELEIYMIDDVVTHNGNFFVCNQDNTRGTWDDFRWNVVYPYVDESAEFDATNFAFEFTEHKIYNQNDIALEKDGDTFKAYQCQDNDTHGIWDDVSHNFVEIQDYDPTARYQIGDVVWYTLFPAAGHLESTIQSLNGKTLWKVNKPIVSNNFQRNDFYMLHIAPVEYNLNDLTTYNGKLYRATQSAVNSPVFNINGTFDERLWKEYQNLNLVWNAGDIVINKNNVYQCADVLPVSGKWDESKWKTLFSSNKETLNKTWFITQWNPVEIFNKGDVIEYTDGALYEAVKYSISGEFDVDEWRKITPYNIRSEILTKSWSTDTSSHDIANFTLDTFTPVIFTYDSSVNYPVGAMVEYEGLFYAATADTNGTWTPGSWSVFDHYDETTTYGANDIRIYDDKLYICLRTTGNIWNSNDWIQIQVDLVEYNEGDLVLSPRDGNDATIRLWRAEENTISEAWNHRYWKEVDARVELYNIGDITLKDGKLYRARLDSITGPWNPRYWEILEDKAMDSTSRLQSDEKLVVRFIEDDNSWTSEYGGLLHQLAKDMTVNPFDAPDRFAGTADVETKTNGQSVFYLGSEESILSVKIVTHKDSNGDFIKDATTGVITPIETTLTEGTGYTYVPVSSGVPEPSIVINNNGELPTNHDELVVEYQYKNPKKPGFKLVYPNATSMVASSPSLDDRLSAIDNLFIVESYGVDVLSDDSSISRSLKRPGGSGFGTQSWRIRFEYDYTDDELKVNIGTKYQILDNGHITSTERRDGVENTVIRQPGELSDVFFAPRYGTFGERVISEEKVKLGFFRRQNKTEDQYSRTYPLSYRLSVTDHGVGFFIWDQASVEQEDDFSWFVVQRHVNNTTGEVDWGDTVGNHSPVHCVYSCSRRPVDTNQMDLYYSSNDVENDKRLLSDIYTSEGKKLINDVAAVSTNYVFDGNTGIVDLSANNTYGEFDIERKHQDRYGNFFNFNQAPSNGHIEPAFGSENTKNDIRRKPLGQYREYIKSNMIVTINGVEIEKAHTNSYIDIVSGGIGTMLNEDENLIHKIVWNDQDEYLGTSYQSYIYDEEHHVLHFRHNPENGSELSVKFYTYSSESPLDTYYIKKIEDREIPNYNMNTNEDSKSIYRFVVRESDVFKPWDVHKSATMFEVDSNPIINPMEQLAITADRNFVFSMPTQLTTQRFFYPTSDLDIIAYSSADFSTFGGRIEIDKYLDSSGDLNILTEQIDDGTGTMISKYYDDTNKVFKKVDISAETGYSDIKPNTLRYRLPHRRVYEGMMSTKSFGNGMRLFMHVNGSSIVDSDVPQGSVD